MRQAPGEAGHTRLVTQGLFRWPLLPPPLSQCRESVAECRESVAGVSQECRRVSQKCHKIVTECRKSVTECHQVSSWCLWVSQSRQHVDTATGTHHTGG